MSRLGKWRRETRLIFLKVGSVMQTTDPIIQQQVKLPDMNACWELVERIVASSQLRRSARLRDLLQFVCRRRLKEGCTLLHEQEIGVEVFGRSATYDTNVDNIVRANVSELRKRIDAYFEDEGSRETLILELPRGSYVPVFIFRPAAQSKLDIVASPVPASLTAPAPEPEEAPASTWWHSSWNRALAVGLVLLFASTSALLLVENLSLRRSMDETQHAFYPWRYEPTVAGFWSNFLDTPQETDVLVPDASFSQIQSYSRTSISLHDYLDRSYVGQLQMTGINSEVRSLLGLSSSLNFVTLSAIKMADNILALDPLKKKMHMYFSREYIPSFIDRDNVIFLGDQRSNPWIQLLESRLNFVEELDHGNLGPVINRSPNAGEQTTYQQTDTVGYCVVAFLSSPSHGGKFLLIQGTSPEATEAAEFFLMSESQLASFQKRLNVSRFPYFEVLLKTSQVTGTPLTATVEAYRIHTES